MRSAGLYSIAWNGLYFEQYIEGYIINRYIGCRHEIEIQNLQKNTDWVKKIGKTLIKGKV